MEMARFSFFSSSSSLLWPNLRPHPHSFNSFGAMLQRFWKPVSSPSFFSLLSSLVVTSTLLEE